MIIDAYRQLTFLGTIEQQEDTLLFRGPEADYLQQLATALHKPAEETMQVLPQMFRGQALYFREHGSSPIIYSDGEPVTEEEDFEEEELEEEFAWDETKHPRHPKGDEKGGEFAAGALTEQAAFTALIGTQNKKAWGSYTIARWIADDEDATHRWVQPYLLGKRKEGSAYERTVQEKIKQLDQVISKSKTPVDVLVYRGMKVKNARKLFKPGIIFKHKTYLATTTDGGKSELFTGRAYGGMSTYLNIHVPKGTSYIIGSSKEREVLFSKGTRLRVIKVIEREGFHGNREMEVKVRLLK